MRVSLILCLLLSSGAVAEEPNGKEAVQEETKRLQGTWEGFAVEGRGERPDRGPVHLRLTIDDTKMSAVDLAAGEKAMGSGTYSIVPSGDFNHIDATGVVLPGKRERTFLGIYKIDGDTLQWCVDNRQKERPTEFKTGGGHYLLILKRKK